MRMIEQSDFLKSAVAAAGVAGVQDLDVRDGQLLLDGCAFVLVPASEHQRLVALAESVATPEDPPPAGDQPPPPAPVSNTRTRSAKKR